MSLDAKDYRDIQRRYGMSLLEVMQFAELTEHIDCLEKATSWEELRDHLVDELKDQRNQHFGKLKGDYYE